MKITEIETWFVEPRLLFVKVSTDEGIVGYGECLPDKAPVQAAVVKSFEHYLVGQDPRQIVHHWQAMYRSAFWRGGPALCGGISGIEIALWDILGKCLNLPVWQLLGGKVRHRIRVYPHCLGETPTDMAMHAKDLQRQGYTACKFSPSGKTRAIEAPHFIDQSVARVAAVREAVGNEMDIFLDFHGRIPPPTAMLLEQALRPYRPSFIEEPVLPENAKVLADFTRRSQTPVATGERLFTKWGFREVLELGAASIIQPDPCVAGGILETRQIAAMGETYYASVALHNPYGPVNMAACLQVAATSPNFYIQEFFRPERINCPHIKESFVIHDGHIDVPTKPGIGVELDEEYCQAHICTEPQVDHGRWFHDDGSVADW